jgi:hypothetical protein
MLPSRANTPNAPSAGFAGTSAIAPSSRGITLRLTRILTVAAAAVVALVGIVPASVGAHASTSGAGYLTIQFGRSIEGSYQHSCTNVVPGILTLSEIAANMPRGMGATGTVVVDRTGTTRETCYGGDIYPDATDLKSLNQAFGWQFVSDGITHDDIATMTGPQQQNDSCGSLAYFQQNLPGDSASGLFAYGGDEFTPAIQKNVVSTCFAYGRTYRGGVNRRATMSPLGFQNTNSITGGACNDRSSACAAPMPGQVGRTYESPQTFEHLLSVETGDQWIDLQFYRLVSGRSSESTAYSWDCTSANWQEHWTSQTEMYCVNDFEAILASVRPGIVTTDPGSVARAWGRFPTA